MESIVLLETDVLTATLSGAQAVDVTVHYADRSAAGQLVPGNAVTALTDTTPTTICTAPASGWQRLIKTVTIANKAAGTINADLCLKRNATSYRIARAALTDNKSWDSNSPS